MHKTEEISFLITLQDSKSKYNQRYITTTIYHSPLPPLPKKQPDKTDIHNNLTEGILIAIDEARRIGKQVAVRKWKKINGSQNNSYLCP